MQLGLDAGLYPDPLIDDNDAVFDSLFFNPSYPFTLSPDSLLDGQGLRDLGVLRQYRCDHDILDAYYIWIHPTFPALPDPQYSPVDRPLGWCPVTPDELPTHCPSNPLILAILAIVIMIPIPGRAQTNTSATRRQISSVIASRAYGSVVLEAQSTLESWAVVLDPAHPLVPPGVESVLALCLLGQYEYLQNGNMEKMQRLTKEALEGAIRLQLHIYPSGSQPKFDDARQRAWWTVYLCACNVTIVSCVPPIMSLKDPTSIYTTAYPETSDWKVHVNAERLLALATLFLMNLIREFGNPAEMELIRKSMQALDAEICRSLGEIDASESSRPSSFYMNVALIRLHSARIKVHRYCALLDDDNVSLDPSSGDRLGALKFAVSTSSGNAMPASSVSTLDPLTSSSSSGRHFPFSSAHSMRYCLESARVILKTLPDLTITQAAGTDSKYYTFTPFACSIVLAGYTFLMLRHKADTCGSSTDSEPADYEIRTECGSEAAACLEVLDGFSQAWMHLGDAAMHMKEAANCL